MACDEVLVESVRKKNSSTTLRVYGWYPPAVSIGYSQDITKEIDLENCREAGIAYVRRPTGGRAVLHWEELTYSVVLPESGSSWGKNITETYLIVGNALRESMKLLGVDAQLEQCLDRQGRRIAGNPCFSSAARYEVLVRGKKLIGSAQRRMNGVILQHGSILIGNKHTRIADIIPALDERAVTTLKRGLQTRTTSLMNEKKTDVSFAEVADGLIRGFEKSLGVKFDRDDLTHTERSRTEKLVIEKYSTDRWNLQRETATIKNGFVFDSLPVG